MHEAKLKKISDIFSIRRGPAVAAAVKADAEEADAAALVAHLEKVSHPALTMPPMF